MLRPLFVWFAIFVFALSQLAPCSVVFPLPQVSAFRVSALAPFISASDSSANLDIEKIPAFLNGDGFRKDRDARISMAIKAYSKNFAVLSALSADDIVKGFEELARSLASDAVSDSFKDEFMAAYARINDTKLGDDERAGADYLAQNMDSCFSERLAVPMAMAFSRLAEEKQAALRRAVLELGERIDLLDDTSYEFKLVLSVVWNPDEWVMSVEIAHSKNIANDSYPELADVAAAMDMVDRNFRQYALSRVGVKGYATDYINVRDLDPVTADDVCFYDDFLDYAGRDMFMATMSDVDLIISILLGGAGTRWRKALRENPGMLADFTARLEKAVPELDGKFIRSFKAALVQGDEMILRKLMKGASEVGCRKILTMLAYHTRELGREIVRKTAENLNADFQNINVVQDVTARRDPETGRVALYFNDSNPARLRIAVPQFGPENHGAYWDCLYESFDPVLDMFVPDPDSPLGVRDAFLRISNQDNVAAAIGFRKDSAGREHGPGVVACNLLRARMKESGVYEWIAGLNRMSQDEWDSYFGSDAFMDDLGSYDAMTVECEDAAFAADDGPGVVRDRASGRLIIVEEPNREGEMAMPFLNINTQTISAMMYVLSEGLRPVDIIALRDARDEGSRLPPRIMKRWARGKARVDGRKPVRMRTRVLAMSWKGRKMSLSVMGRESDIHFRAGRVLKMIPLIIRSSAQFNARAKEWDISYLKGDISYEELLRREEDFAVGLGFIPIKRGEDVLSSSRAALAVKRTEAGGRSPANMPLRPVRLLIAECLREFEKIRESERKENNGLALSLLSLDVIIAYLADNGYVLDPDDRQAQAAVAGLVGGGYVALSRVVGDRGKSNFRYMLGALRAGLPVAYVFRELFDAEVLPDFAGLRISANNEELFSVKTVADGRGQTVAVSKTRPGLSLYSDIDFSHSVLGGFIHIDFDRDFLEEGRERPHHFLIRDAFLRNLTILHFGMPGAWGYYYNCGDENVLGGEEYDGDAIACRTGEWVSRKMPLLRIPDVGDAWILDVLSREYGIAAGSKVYFAVDRAARSIKSVNESLGRFFHPEYSPDTIEFFGRNLFRVYPLMSGQGRRKVMEMLLEDGGLVRAIKITKANVDDLYMILSNIRTDTVDDLNLSRVRSEAALWRYRIAEALSGFTDMENQGRAYFLGEYARSLENRLKSTAEDLLDIAGDFPECYDIDPEAGMNIADIMNRVVAVTLARRDMSEWSRAVGVMDEMIEVLLFANLRAMRHCVFEAREKLASGLALEKAA